MLNQYLEAVGRLDQVQWSRLHDAVRRLEQSWQAGKPLSLREVLAARRSDDESVRLRLLAELVKVDQEYRWCTGQERLLEAYLSEWPELAADRSVVLELLMAECLTRISCGGREPTREELVRRFPDVGAAVDLDGLGRVTALERSALSCELLDTWAGTEAGVRRDASLLETVRLDKPKTDRPESGSTGLRLESRLRPGAKVGRYEIVSLLGQGGMGAVYRAYDTKLQRLVALKIPRPELSSDPKVVQRFLREARAAARIDHPNVCTIYDFGEQDGTLYLTLRFVEGPTLREVIRRGQLTPDQAARIAAKLADALQAVHSAGLVHRDVKASNVMLQDGEPLLMDFGLARPTWTEEELSERDELIGTVPYMAPEQVKGDAADQRADIYALGALLYHLLTGRTPFTGSRTSVLYQIAHVRPQPPSRVNAAVPEALDRICLKALAKQPDHRYQSAAEMAADLNAFLQGKRVAARRRRWTRVAAWAGAVLVLAAAALVFVKTGSGTLELDVPDDARVVVDGERVQIERGGAKVVVSVGPHTVEVTQSGRTVRLPVRIRWRGETRRVRIPRPPRAWPAARRPFSAGPRAPVGQNRPPVVLRVGQRDALFLCEPERLFPVPQAVTRGIQFSPTDGSLLVLAGDRSHPAVTRWDVKTGRLLERLDFDVADDVPKEYEHVHDSAVLTRDGRYLFVTNYYSDYVTRVDLTDKSVRHVRVGTFTDEVWAEALVLTPDERRLVVAIGQDGRVPETLHNDGLSVLDVSHGRLKLVDELRLPDEVHGRQALALSPDGRLAYVVCWKTTPKPRLFEIQLGPPCQVLRTLALPSGLSQSLLVSPKRNCLYVGDPGNRKVWVVDLQQWHIRGELQVEGYSPSWICLSPNEDVLAVVSDEARRLLLLDLRTGTCVGGAVGLEGGPHRACFSPDGRYLVVSHTHGGVAVYPTDQLLTQVAFASDLSGGGHQIYVAAFQGRRWLQVTDNPAANRYPRWSPDGTKLAFVSNVSGLFRLWVAERNRWSARELPGTETVVNAPWEFPYDWSPDGKQLAFITRAQDAVRVVDVETGRVRTLLDGPADSTHSCHNALCWNPKDGRIYLETQVPGDASSQELFCLDPKTREVTAVTHLPGPPHVTGVAARPDSSELAAVYSPDGSLLSRRLALLQPDGRLQVLRHVPAGAIRCVTWLPDGERLVYSRETAGRYRLWWTSLKQKGGPLTAGQWEDRDPDVWGVLATP